MLTPDVIYIVERELRRGNIYSCALLVMHLLLEAVEEITPFELAAIEMSSKHL